MGVAERKRQPERLVFRPVADADDLKRLFEAAGDPFDHVGDKSARQAMQGAMLGIIRGALNQNVSALAPNPHVLMQGPGEFTVGTFDPHGRSFNRDIHPGRNGDRLLSNS